MLYLCSLSCSVIRSSSRAQPQRTTQNEPMHPHAFTVPLLNLLAACLLLISFAMLSRRRTQRLITLFAWQGGILFLSTCLVAYSSGLRELYYSAALTLLLKVILLPLILHKLIGRL